MVMESLGFLVYSSPDVTSDHPTLESRFASRELQQHELWPVASGHPQCPIYNGRLYAYDESSEEACQDISQYSQH